MMLQCALSSYTLTSKRIIKFTARNLKETFTLSQDSLQKVHTVKCKAERTVLNVSRSV